MIEIEHLDGSFRTSPAIFIYAILRDNLPVCIIFEILLGLIGHRVKQSIIILFLLDFVVFVICAIIPVMLIDKHIIPIEGQIRKERLLAEMIYV